MMKDERRKTKELLRNGFTPTLNLNNRFCFPRLRDNIRNISLALSRQLNRGGARNNPNLVWGFTLLETIVALAVITAVVVGPVVLITSGLISFGFAKNKLIALNLAQEGLELIRAVRENNILCDEIEGGNNWDWF